ncbi:MAG: hypothetical protein AAB326_06815, partial [Pseudomonadota bacterium]
MLKLNIILLHIGHSSDLIQSHYLPLISIALSARFESATQTPVFQIYTSHNLFFMLNSSIKKALHIEELFVIWRFKYRR